MAKVKTKMLVQLTDFLKVPKDNPHKTCLHKKCFLWGNLTHKDRILILVQIKNQSSLSNISYGGKLDCQQNAGLNTYNYITQQENNITKAPSTIRKICNNWQKAVCEWVMKAAAATGAHESKTISLKNSTMQHKINSKH